MDLKQRSDFLGLLYRFRFTARWQSRAHVVLRHLDATGNSCWLEKKKLFLAFARLSSDLFWFYHRFIHYSWVLDGVGDEFNTDSFKYIPLNRFFTRRHTLSGKKKQAKKKPCIFREAKED